MKVLETLSSSLTNELWWVVHAVQYYFQGTYTGRILGNFWDLASQLWYFAFLGALISTLVWRFLPKTWVRRQLERRGAGSIALASLLGLLSPMCTFAAIPVVGTLLRMGVPAPPLFAFMVASPLMNPSLFAYTAGVIGMEMAVARLLTALSVGLFAGFATRVAMDRGLLAFGELSLEKVPAGLYPAVSGGVDLSAADQVRLLLRRFGQDLAFIGRFFALGVFIAALVKVFLTEAMVLALVGPGSRWAVPSAVALGVPLYACGGGSLPIVESMMQMGMSTGAALAFFIAGPATKFSTLTMLGAVFGRRVLAFYLTLMLAAALFWGYAYPFSSRDLEVRTGVGAPYEELVGE